MAEPMLKVENLNVYYGAIHALKGVSFEVNEGEIVTLIGANGAGKSTTLNTVCGLLRNKSRTPYQSRYEQYEASLYIFHRYFLKK